MRHVLTALAVLVATPVDAREAMLTPDSSTEMWELIDLSSITDAGGGIQDVTIFSIGLSDQPFYVRKHRVECNAQLNGLNNPRIVHIQTIEHSPDGRTQKPVGGNYQLNLPSYICPQFRSSVERKRYPIDAGFATIRRSLREAALGTYSLSVQRAMDAIPTLELRDGDLVTPVVSGTVSGCSIVLGLQSGGNRTIPVVGADPRTGTRDIGARKSVPFINMVMAGRTIEFTDPKISVLDRDKAPPPRKASAMETMFGVTPYQGPPKDGWNVSIRRIGAFSSGITDMARVCRTR